MKIVLLRFGLMVCLMLSAVNPAWSVDRGREQRVLILPPVIHGPAEMAYLRQGLVDMLSTRLADPGKVVIIVPDPETLPGGPVSKTLAATSAQTAGADHVVFGSITLLGNRISTDLHMIDAATGQVTVAFSQSGADASTLIEHADLFAARANQKVFGRAGSGQAADQPKAAPSDAPDTPTDPTYLHPEKLLQQPMAAGEDGRYGQDDFGTVLIGAASAVRGPRINDQVQSLAIGDVDGDGALDIVIAGLSKLWIYKFTDGRFVKMAELKGSGNYIGVDTSDVNENGRQEIFVTNFDNDNGRVSSFVVEYDGRDFKRKAQLLDLYFRAINVPMRGRVLFAQRRGLEALFQPGIHEIVWENGKYRRGSRLKVPRNQNIFGMGLGTLPPSPDQMIFAYDAATRLQVMDNTGREERISSEGFGNVAALVQTKAINDLSGRDYHYIAGRIEMVDLDGDGGEEAVVLRNEDRSGNFTKRTRLFKHGRIEILKIDQLGMTARLRTRYMPKFISDFAVGDLDGDGKPEILTAVVQKTKHVASSGRTNIYLFSVDSF